MLFGEDGLIKRAQNAVAKWEEAAQNEQEALNSIDDDWNCEDENPGVLEGGGQANDPYTINSIEDLVTFLLQISTGNKNYEEEYVQLGRNLNFSSVNSYVDPYRTDFGEFGELSGLGDFHDLNLDTIEENFITELTTSNGFISFDGEFAGIFDGKSYWIKNLMFNSNNIDIQEGGFIYNNSGTIKNLNISGSFNLLDGLTFGGIATYNNGTIENCNNYISIDILSTEENRCSNSRRNSGPKYWTDWQF